MKKSLFLTLGMLAAISAVGENTPGRVIRTINPERGGELAVLLGDGAEEMDSLIVAGPLNSDDFAEIRRLARHGKLRGLNIRQASLEEGLEPYCLGESPWENEGVPVKLEYISLPSVLEEVGEYAMWNIASLRQVELPEKLRAINEYALWNCGLETLDIPEGVTALRLGALDRNASLRSVAFPSTLEYVGLQNGNWSSVETVICRATVPPQCDLDKRVNCLCSSFEGSSKGATLYVPKGSGESYRKAIGWMYFENIVEKDVKDLGIESPEVERQLSVSAKGGRGVIILTASGPFSYAVYDMSGMQVAGGAGNGSVEAPLAPGHYIATVNGQAVKLQVK